MSTHDENFKHNFTNKKVAHDFLLHNLPQKVLERIDIATVTIESNEFLPSRYRSKRRADILYSVKDKQGKKVYALLHVEAQSKQDKHMALRVWEYHVAITRAHVKQGNEKVPLILTFVLYHGKDTWTSAQSIAELFDDFELYVDVSLKAPFLINLKEKEIGALKTQGASSAPQLIMKGQAHGDFCPMLDTLYPLLKSYNQLDEENIDYIITNDQHEPPALFEKIRTFDQATANHYKNMFEAAIRKESQKSLKMGLIKGKIEGKKEGKIEIAIQMIIEGMKADLIARVTGLSLKEIEKLTR